MTDPRRRALPLRAELRRQLTRRRTRVTAALLAALPLLLVGAFALGDDDPGAAPTFVDLAQVGAANLTVFTLYASAGFLLPVVVALVAGDAVPSEASWGTLRYLLTAPVPRGRLLRAKLFVAAASSLVVLVGLAAWTLLVGLVAYGGAGYRDPTGARLDWSAFAPRLLVSVLVLWVLLGFVAGLSFLVGVVTDAPLGAVGSAVLATVLSSILDSISALGSLRQALPTHYLFAWGQLLRPDPDVEEVLTGCLWSLLYATVLLTAAFWHFGRKDVLS
ncbi:ABC transporter permease [Nocardioides acrostichi]|uniref:ABC transporter permease n=1 Tax=Nocardioides acrostichi TaxID=2784339 RepID=A0A930V4D6_9ACTN|nr:ABC transporter permease [Nocardioides acrostichi]MBF4163784.1 ABC transporter permease [Nocardioides acrostichi]